MSDDKFKIFEERLTRLEAALSQRPAGTVGGSTLPGGVIVDPAPWGGGWGRPRWSTHPVVDPAPWPPGVVSDPAPWPPSVVSDPAPWGGGVFNPSIGITTFGRIGPTGGDPAPPDFSRLSVSQLESTLHSINAEKARLDSMETMITKQLERAKKQEKG